MNSPLLQHCRIHFEGLFVKPEVSVVVPLHSFVVFPTIQLLYIYLELNKYAPIDHFLRRFSKHVCNSVAVRINSSKTNKTMKNMDKKA